MIEPIKFPGNDIVNAKTKALADAANTLYSLRGDDLFIRVKMGPGYAMISLNVQAVLARMPRFPGGGSDDTGAGQYQGEVRGNVTDGQMGNGPIILVDIP